MKFEELRIFLLEEMMMEDGNNYQPVMIKTLINSGGKATKNMIRNAIENENPQKEIQSHSIGTVCKVLTQNHKVAKENNDGSFSLLDFETYTTTQLKNIVNICDEKIIEASTFSSTEKRLILFSVSGQASFDHFEDTILNDVDTSKFSESEMKQFPRVRTWGSIPNKWALAKWSKLQKGDIILFYRDKKYVTSAILEGTEQNRITAKQMWGTKPDSEDTWELIMYMRPENVRRSNVDFQILNTLLNYKENFMPTRILDFTLVRNDVTRNLIKEYGSVEDALNKIGFPITESWESMGEKNLEEIIKEFDRNRNYFASDRTLKKDETFKYRDEFLAKFPIDKIPNMKLDDYVIGKPDETTGEPRRDTFSYYLEKSLKAFGRISGRWSRFHGIYWNKDKNGYVWNGEFNNQNEAFEAIKFQIFSMVRAARALEKDGDWNKFAEFMSTQGKTVMANIKNKILCVYFPNLFLTLHKKQLLDDVLDEFHIKFNRKESRYLKEKKILDVKSSHPIMKNWDNLDLSYFLWKSILSRDEDIDSEDVGDFDEDVVSENNYLLLRHSAKKENKWRDDIGKQYHFGRIPNYTKLIPGSKTIWYDRDGGDFYYWGYGDISKTEKESEDHIHAYFDKFTYFNKPSKESPTTDDVVPKKGDKGVQQQIMNLPGWNNQISMLPITKNIYDAIINAKKLSEQGEQVKTFADMPLEPVSEQDMRAGYEELSQELLIPEKKVTEIVTALASGSHVILVGPIGTGKTELARKIPQIFWKKVGGYYSDIFTATADWNTQDVIAGIVPKMSNGNVAYKIQDGCVTESMRKNWVGDLRRPYGEYHGVWTIIDEFNRADIDKAFGQLFTSLRTKELKIPSDLSEKNYEELKIPNDYRIIGTLNSADKHYLFPLSNALKSRFAFIEIDIPGENQYQQEIYYATKNALNTFGPKYASLVNLDHKHKTLNTIGGTEFDKIVFQAYNFLAFVRLYKKLGTAILKILIQNLVCYSSHLCLNFGMNGEEKNKEKLFFQFMQRRIQTKLRYNFNRCLFLK